MKPNKKRKRSILRKCKEEKEGNSNNDNNEFNKLTMDIIACIFMRCPVQTLALLCCASKSWNDFITSPSFVHSHIKRSTENAQVLFVKHKYLHDRCRLRFVCIDMEEKEENSESHTVTVDDYQLASSYWLVCSGLVCLATKDHIYLCNPVMNQLCSLPKWSTSAFPGPDVFGFGYLHSKKEYKVVHFFYEGVVGRLRDLQLEKLRCEVFTLNGVGGMANSWKEIAEMPPWHPSLPGLVVNECMYWLGKITLCPSGKLDRIVSFDFENENFLTVSPPSSFETLSGLGMAMMDLKGLLCLPDMDHLRRSSILDLWVLKDKISCIWMKDYSINLANFECENITPNFGTWDDEIIFKESGMVVFYDLKTKCFREVGGLPKTVFGIYQKCLFSL